MFVCVGDEKRERERKRQPLEVPPLDPRLLLVILALAAISGFAPRSLVGLKQMSFDLLTLCCYICVALCVRVTVCSFKIEIQYAIEREHETSGTCILIFLNSSKKNVLIFLSSSVSPPSPARSKHNNLYSLVTLSNLLIGGQLPIQSHCADLCSSIEVVGWKVERREKLTVVSFSCFLCSL